MPPAGGDRAEAAAARRPSAALEITDRVAAAVGEIARPALAVGGAAAVAAAGAVAVAASAVVVSVAAVVSGDNPGKRALGVCRSAVEALAVNHAVQRFGGWECRTSRS